jgi:hypothetical protein
LPEDAALKQEYVPDGSPATVGNVVQVDVQLPKTWRVDTIDLGDCRHNQVNDLLY